MNGWKCPFGDCMSIFNCIVSSSVIFNYRNKEGQVLSTVQLQYGMKVGSCSMILYEGALNSVLTATSG